MRKEQNRYQAKELHVFTDMENKYAHYKNVERKSLSSVRNIQYKLFKPTNIVTTSRKSQKKCQSSKNLCGKAICWDYVLVGLASFPCPALWVYCKTEPSLEEEAPSVRARKLQRISGGFFARSTNPPPNQPNPTTQPSTSSTTQPTLSRMWPTYSSVTSYRI